MACKAFNKRTDCANYPHKCPKCIKNIKDNPINDVINLMMGSK